MKLLRTKCKDTKRKEILLMFKKVFHALLITTLLMGLGGILTTIKVDQIITEGGVHFEEAD